MDSTLLKEAIADAKAVRQTALANAKVALEEAFSERYQAMFAEKLKEDAEMGTAQPQAEEGQVNAQGN
jgi:Lon protease-like protein